MTFSSILFPGPAEGRPTVQGGPPEFFGDLNLDQVVDAIVAGRDEYDLAPFFYTSLLSLDVITYRHEVMRDLEHASVRACIDTFAKQMRLMRDRWKQVERLHYSLQKQPCLLEAVQIYTDAILTLARDLRQQSLHSPGLEEFRNHVARYAESTAFRSLVTEVSERRHDLAGVSYSLLIKGDRATVGRYEGEADFGAEVMTTFEKFKQRQVKDYLAKFPDLAEMNHVEAQVLGLVARLHAHVFTALNDFCLRHRGYVDDTIATFDREVQFYLAYLDFVADLKSAGLSFCYPHLRPRTAGMHACQTFDIALAHQLVHEDSQVVCNDFSLRGKERIFVVTGPNQGGKTTFARTFGQLHFLATLGCPVPGNDVQLVLVDHLFTHFEREEDLTNLRGKLEDELVRVHRIFQDATPDSVIVMNETFTSTSLQDAMFLSTRIMERLIGLDAPVVFVTFLDELASHGQTTVSMVSEVESEGSDVRTYKLVRRPADGLAYAASLAEKYGLSHATLKERLAS